MAVMIADLIHGTSRSHDRIRGIRCDADRMSLAVCRHGDRRMRP